MSEMSHLADVTHEFAKNEQFSIEKNGITNTFAIRENKSIAIFREMLMAPALATRL